ncbi:PREDICTED: ras-related protein RABE1a-like [Fragaria vesca subsp. vesca]|uniref:ras-related protein RABE1a-like n=1 Tax=Fragaria vesca subsp. vesca TaxID=101020 RepID=UPI0002C330F3|nr:PREDICTED: ras-related protein RABE1a-like [Fragaria vesca subsp. vesca]
MAAPHDHFIKLLLLGDSGVGKTSLLLRLSDKPFNASFMTTIGIDFSVKTIELDGERVKLQIWDTAGQERFRTITRGYYKAAKGILLVYDITSESSFNHIRDWIRDMEEKHPPTVNVKKILVGNKGDMGESQRAVSKSRGQALADEYWIKFFETSARTKMNVEEVFFALARVIRPELNVQQCLPLEFNRLAAQRSSCCR